MLDEIITQLKAEVADFENRVDTAAQLAALVRSGNLPNRTPCAYVVPLGFTTKPQTAAAGMFIQSITPRIGVVIAVNTAGDASGSKSLPSSWHSPPCSRALSIIERPSAEPQAGEPRSGRTLDPGC